MYACFLGVGWLTYAGVLGVALAVPPPVVPEVVTPSDHRVGVLLRRRALAGLAGSGFISGSSALAVSAAAADSSSADEPPIEPKYGTAAAALIPMTRRKMAMVRPPTPELLSMPH